jgi:hypothetical protein
VCLGGLGACLLGHGGGQQGKAGDDGLLHDGTG